MTARPLLALLLALALPASALPVAAQEATSEAPVAPAPPAITVTEVAPVALRDRVIASGLVSAVEEVQVQPLIEGQPIDELLADVGDRVAAGQVLARLSTSTLELQRSQLVANRAAVEAQVAQAEATLIDARATAADAARQAERNRQLAEDGTVPQAQADTASAAAESAAARVRAAEQGVVAAQAQIGVIDAQVASLDLQVSRAEVAAPVGGLVVGRNAQVGAVASAAGQPLFTIVRDGAMELSVDVSEGDLMRLRPGQAATLRASESAAPLRGTVRLVEPSIDPATRLGTARITIEDPTQVVTGMFLQAEILVREARELAVPASAVASDPSGAAVMRVEDGVVRRVPVATGIRDGDLVGVDEGLGAGDLVVTRAGAFVRDGDRINPVREDAAAAPPDPTQAAGAAAAAPAQE